MVIKDLNRKAN